MHQVHKQSCDSFLPRHLHLLQALQRVEGLFRQAVLVVEDLLPPEVVEQAVEEEVLRPLVVEVTRAAEAVVVLLPPPVVEAILAEVARRAAQLPPLLAVTQALGGVLPPRAPVDPLAPEGVLQPDRLDRVEAHQQEEVVRQEALLLVEQVVGAPWPRVQQDREVQRLVPLTPEVAQVVHRDPAVRVRQSRICQPLSRLPRDLIPPSTLVTQPLQPSTV